MAKVARPVKPMEPDKLDEYVAHVSFDDLTPGFVDSRIRLAQQLEEEGIAFANPFLQVPGQAKTKSEESSRRSTPSLDLYHASRSSRGSSTNAMDAIAGASMNGGLRSPKSEALRSSGTPSPPMSTSGQRSILRKPDHLHQQSLHDIEDFDLMDLDPHKDHQIDSMTNRNTQENSGCPRGYTTSAFSNLNEVEDKIMRKEYSVKSASSGGSGGRKKSFAGMSDAELLALEKKYEAGSRTNYKVEQFDFGEQAQLYIEPEGNRPVGPTNQWPQTIYPSRPCVNHHALTVTKVHRDFLTYVMEHRYHDDRESLRTILCAISGRRHTWSAIDWYVENLARDGDHLVIATRIPLFEDSDVDGGSSAPPSSFLDDFDFKNDKSMSRSLSRRSSATGRVLAAQDIDFLARVKCNAILDYYLEKLNGKRLKVTVELIKNDSTTYALTSAIALYKPDFKIISTVSTNLHIKFRNGHVKLPNFVMRHFWVPTYVIPYEFIDPALLGEKTETPRKAANFSTNMSDAQVMRSIDRVITRTLTNPYGPRDQPAKCGPDADVASVDSYFPMDPETKRKMEEFESVGYLRPVPSRRNCNLSKQTSFASSKSSRRSSRVQFSGADSGGVYKVKSLIDYDDKDGGAARKTRSSVSTQSNGKSSVKKRPSSTRRAKSMDATPLVEGKKKSNKFGGFLKKLGIGK